MTRTEREILVERYQAFEMSAAEEQEFIIRAATDNEIHRILRASRLVQKALEQNRAKLPTGHLGVRERALTLLAATPAVEATAPAASPASTGALQGARRTAGWMSHAATALVFAVGGYLTHEILPPTSVAPSAQVSTVSSPQPAAISPGSSRVEETKEPVAQPMRIDIDPTGVRERGTAPAVTGRKEESRPAAAVSKRSGASAPGSIATGTAVEEPRVSTVVEPSTTVAAPPVSKPDVKRSQDSGIVFKGKINRPKIR